MKIILKAETVEELHMVLYTLEAMEKRLYYGIDCRHTSCKHCPHLKLCQQCTAALVEVRNELANRNQ